MRAIKPDYQALAHLRAAMRSFERSAEEAARAHGLTPQRYILLLMVKGAADGSERATVNELAARLRVAPHTVSGAVRRAEDAGLLRRKPCPQDRRRTWVSLTAAGEERLHATVAALEAERHALAAAVEESVRGAALD